MANPLHHAISAARHFASDDDLYGLFLPIEEWFDETKGWLPDFRHRAIRHHSEGIAEAVKLFGPIELPSGRLIPVRFVAERHVVEDLGRIPTAADWLRCLRGEPWMTVRARKLSRELQKTSPNGSTQPTSTGQGAKRHEEPKEAVWQGSTG